ncbi:Uncharacterised protein [uncultured archaeon]|nr:Uncharacterised protein [uncultured archaeon]
MASAATEGETPGIQATTEPHRLPEKTAVDRLLGGILISVSSCSGISVSVDRLRTRAEAPKMPDKRGSSTCGSRPRGEESRLSWSKAKTPRRPLVRKSRAARILYFQCTRDPCPSIQGPLSDLIIIRAMPSNRTPTYFMR